MVKEVKGCNRVIEITLDGTECAVKFDAKYNGFDIRNKSGKDITVSLKSGAAKGDDGVITIGDGETFNYMHMMGLDTVYITCLLYTSPSPRDRQKSRMPSSA